MTRLLFVRHGQASFGAENYDVLSTTGVTQSQHLGAYFARIERPLAAVISGEMERQRDTARHLIESAARQGLTIPAPVVDVGFNEYPAFEILDHAIARAPDDPHVRALLGTFDDGGEDERGALRQKERAIHGIMRRWAEGSLDVGALETFVAFDARVNDAIDRVLAARPHAQERDAPPVAVVTSGGPVAIAVKRALSLSPAATIDLAWTIMNASFTEFVVRRQTLQLHRFNAVPHIEPERLITFR